MTSKALAGGWIQRTFGKENFSVAGYTKKKEGDEISTKFFALTGTSLA